MPDEPTHLADVTLAILAGGEGSRMGKPKGLLEVSGQPILRYLLDRFAWPGPTLLVTAPGREHPPGWEAFDREAVDAVAGEGPLRGIVTALSACETELLVVTTVDMPAVDREQLDWLVRALASDGDAMVLMCRRGDSIEPFPCALRGDARAIIAARLMEGRRSVHGLADDRHVSVRPSPSWPPAVWTNVNSPNDLESWLAEARRAREEIRARIGTLPDSTPDIAEDRLR